MVGSRLVRRTGVKRVRLYIGRTPCGVALLALLLVCRAAPMRGGRHFLCCCKESNQRKQLIRCRCQEVIARYIQGMDQHLSVALSFYRVLALPWLPPRTACVFGSASFIRLGTACPTSGMTSQVVHKLALGPEKALARPWPPPRTARVFWLGIIHPSPHCVPDERHSRRRSEASMQARRSKFG